MKIYLLIPDFSILSNGRTGLTKRKPLFTNFRVGVRSEKPRSDFYVSTIRLVKLWVEGRPWPSEQSFALMHNRSVYIKTYIRFISTVDINLPLEHFCATIIIFTQLIVTCSWRTHTELIVDFPLKQWERERSRTLRYTYIAYVVS
jgi:hypothetical protein